MEHILEMVKNFDLTGTGIRVIGAILILVVGIKLANLFIKLITKGKEYHKLDMGMQTFLKSFLSVVLKIVIVFTAIATLGIPMTTLVTVLGTAGVAIGLALQGGLSNIAGGMIILFFKPYGVGDFISYAGNSGTVSEINIFHTILETVDNRKIIIPNGTLANGEITNFSANETRRVDLTFGTSYKADISKVEEILKKCAESHEKALKDPAPFASISAHKDSSLEFVLRVWCNSADYWTVYFDLMKNVKEEFDKNGIEIPYPQLDVHLDK